MGVLLNLTGVKNKQVEAVFIKKSSEIKKILDSGKAATTADQNGAINIWQADDKSFYCEAMRMMRTIDIKNFSKISDVEKWIKEYLKKIK